MKGEIPIWVIIISYFLIVVIFMGISVFVVVFGIRIVNDILLGPDEPCYLLEYEDKSAFYNQTVTEEGLWRKLGIMVNSNRTIVDGNWSLRYVACLNE